LLYTTGIFRKIKSNAQQGMIYKEKKKKPHLGYHISFQSLEGVGEQKAKQLS
jgi:hypothetical protein